ncbi:MAG: VanZ family protein [Egibacteraceae bacterium]
MLALLAARPLARWVRVAPSVAGALVVAATLPLVVTLSPLEEASATRSCSWALPTMESLTSVSDSSLNVVLLLPLGFLATRTRHPWLLLAAAACLPFVVEGLQWLLPALGRACQGEDLVTNLAGLALGALLSLGVRRGGER